MKKEWIGIIIIIILALGIALTIMWTKGESKEIKIGAVLPLTGSAAIWGQNVKNGIDLALEEVNSHGGINGKKIHVIYEDSGGLPQGAVNALHKIIATYNVPAVIGEVTSSGVLAMAPIAERQKVVLLSPGASNPEITNAGEYIFRNWHSDNLEGTLLAEIAYTGLKMHRMCIIYVNNGYGKGLEKVFSEKFARLGGSIAASVTFEQDATDFRTQLTQIKATDCNGVFLPGYPKEIPEVLKQAKELRVQKQFLCPSAFEDQQTLDLARGAAEGVIYLYPKQGDLSKSHVANFYRNYKERYGKPPGALSDTGYDALMLLAEAMRSTGINGTEIKNGLLKIKNYPGVAGDVTFDENGDIIKEFELKNVKNGRFTKYEE